MRLPLRRRAIRDLLTSTKSAAAKLLQERFQLAVRRQTKEGSGYALVVAKNGPKLQETKGDPPHAYIIKGGLRLQNSSLDGLAGSLTRPAGRPIVNETGIKGNFDINLDYAPEGAANSDCHRCSPPCKSN